MGMAARDKHEVSSVGYAKEAKLVTTDISFWGGESEDWAPLTVLMEVPSRE